MRKEKIELLDFTKTNEQSNNKINKSNKINNQRKEKIIILLVVIYSILAMVVYHTLVKDMLKKDRPVVVAKIKEAYTTSKNGRNLTLYDDKTFKYMDLEKVKTGMYKIEGNVYTLTYDDAICELVKNDDILSSSCKLVMSSEEISYMNTKNIKISKILYNINNDNFTKISSTFITYINGLSITKKYPNLKASKVDSINDCFTVDNMKTFTCLINYTVIPDEVDLNKSVWKENGEIVNGSIKKFHYVTFTIKDNNYRFVKMDTKL